MGVSAASIFVGVSFVALGLYDLLGVLFLVRDYSVVHGCHASNVDVHTIWPTSLWTYVLFSLIFITLASLALTALPVRRSGEAARKTMTRRKMSPRGSPS